VLKAVNLGHDTDTTAAVTGGLAGLLYGFDGIPSEWINSLARKSDIEELVESCRNLSLQLLKSNWT
jgi:ADP-ribosylglycohydrolase